MTLSGSLIFPLLYVFETVIVQTSEFPFTQKIEKKYTER